MQDFSSSKVDGFLDTKVGNLSLYFSITLDYFGKLQIIFVLNLAHACSIGSFTIIDDGEEMVIEKLFFTKIF